MKNRRYVEPAEKPEPLPLPKKPLTNGGEYWVSIRGVPVKGTILCSKNGEDVVFINRRTRRAKLLKSVSEVYDSEKAAAVGPRAGVKLWHVDLNPHTGPVLEEVIYYAPEDSMDRESRYYHYWLDAEGQEHHESACFNNYLHFVRTRREALKLLAPHIGRCVAHHTRRRDDAVSTQGKSGAALKALMELYTECRATHIRVNLKPTPNRSQLLRRKKR